MPLCECGCGGEVVQKYSFYIPRFISGHNTRVSNPMDKEEARKKLSTTWFRKRKPKILVLCSCSCGQLTKEGRKYIWGHNAKGKKLPEEHGFKVWKSRRKNGTDKMSEEGKKKLREISSSSRLEVRKKFSESRKGKKYSQEYKDKMSIIITEIMKKPEVKAKVSAASKLSNNKPERKKQLRDFMINGGAVYARSKIKRPTKPQKQLFQMLMLLCPHPILEYPIYITKKWNYNIDVGDEKLGLAFEYDELYWHSNKLKDLKRQKRIEQQGWTFLRYVKLPTLEQLRQDINQKLKERLLLPS